MAGFEVMIDGFVSAFQIIISGDPSVTQIALLSLGVSLTATLLGALFGIPLGFLITRRDFFGRSAITACINTLMGLPPVVVGLVVYLFLSASGPLGFLRLLYTPQAMVTAQFILVFPIVCGITISSIQSINPKLKETLLSLSASPTWEARVIIKESRMGLITGLITGFGAAISEVGAVMIVGGNLLGYTRTLTTSIMLYTNMGEFALAIALGIILLLIALGVNLFLTILQSRSRVKRTV